MLTYQAVTDSFNQAMLGGHDDRVALLKQILAALNHPERRYHIIHIAGTNGKGSTGSMIQQTLQTAGQRVGYFSSPALVDEREQIRVNNQMIDKSTFVQVYQSICHHLPDTIKPAMISVFEWWTLIMLQYFADQAVDWAVIECGLGGQDDATNAIDAPDLAVITHIALDHTRILGPTIEDIASAKAGIIKSGTQAAVLAPHQAASAQAIIADRCHQQSVPLFLAERVHLSHQDQQIELSFDRQQLHGHLNLLGQFQFDNVRTVAQVVSWLIKHQVIANWQPFLQTIDQINIPGRMQIIQQRPLIILDGAHNPDAAQQMVASLQSLRKGRRLIMVIGFLADKKWPTMVADYQQIADQLIITSPDHPQRALSVATLHQAIPDALTASDGRQALNMARAVAQPDDVIVVTGSFYLIKELEEHS